MHLPKIKSIKKKWVNVVANCNHQQAATATTSALGLLPYKTMEEFWGMRRAS